MTNSHQSPLILHFRVSRIGVGLLCLVHLGAVVILTRLDLSGSWVFAVAVLVLLSLGYHLLRLPGMPTGTALRTISRMPDGAWHMTRGAGRMDRTVLRRYSLFSTGVVILTFRHGSSWLPWRSDSVVLFRDTLDREAFRRLKVCLNTQNPVETDQ